MVRAPCCEKMGLKRGSWTTEEDQILINYIQQHGHDNWRALPKQAGLLRCGKSCRLRWINYLRPDIKRGNFSKEEEENIIKLHEMLGNRWSTIAAKLPGRTDNEIKNVWHTHLKKRLKNHQNTSDNNKSQSATSDSNSNPSSESKSIRSNIPTNLGIQIPASPQDSSSELSSITDLTPFPNKRIKIKNEKIESSEIFSQINESLWSEELSFEKSNLQSEFLEFEDKFQFLLPFPPATDATSSTKDCANKCSFNIDDGKDFWYNLLVTSGGHLPELPEF